MDTGTTTYTATINDMTIEAATIKQLNKLVKKEQQRQEHERAREGERSANAYEIAWAHYGRIASALARDHFFLWFDTRTPHHTNEYQRFIILDSMRYGTAELIIGKEYACEAILIDSAGNMHAVRIRDPYVQDNAGISWFAVGHYHGAVARHLLEDHDQERLEARYQADLVKRNAH